MKKAIIDLDKQVKDDSCDVSDLPQAIRFSLLNPSWKIFLQKKQEDKSPRCGYGRCSKCGCRGYEGGGYICENCGHHFDAHY